MLTLIILILIPSLPLLLSQECPSLEEQDTQEHTLLLLLLLQLLIFPSRYENLGLREERDKRRDKRWRDSKRMKIA
jgi:hypothetical protein